MPQSKTAIFDAKNHILQFTSPILLADTPPVPLSLSLSPAHNLQKKKNIYIYIYI
jgi:hypothetical protein